MGLSTNHRAGLIAAAVVVSALTGCSIFMGQPTALAPAEIQGTWALSSLVITSKSDSAQRFDATAAGATGTFQVSPQERFMLVFAAAHDAPPDTSTGRLVVHGDTAIVVDDESQRDSTASLTRKGDHLTLRMPRVEFDFDQDGSADPAAAIAQFSRTHQ